MSSRTKLLTLTLLGLIALGVLVLQPGARRIEAQDPPPPRHTIDVQAVGGVNSVRLHFEWRSHTGCTGCTFWWATYRYRVKSPPGDWMVSPNIGPEGIYAPHYFKGYFTFRIPGLQPNTTYEFEVDIRAHDSNDNNKEIHWAHGKDEATTTNQPSSNTAVPDLRGGPGSKAGTWWVSWSEPPVCGQGEDKKCTHWEVSFRKASDPDDQVNWTVHRVKLPPDTPIPSQRTYDSNRWIPIRKFPYPLIVEVTLWNDNMIVARSRTDLSPTPLRRIVLRAVGPDESSTGIALRQARLSWDNPWPSNCAICVPWKYRVRYTPDNPDSASARWSSWMAAGNWTEHNTNMTPVPLTLLLTLPLGERQYTIDIELYQEGTSTNAFRASVQAQGRAQVRTYDSPESYVRFQEERERAASDADSNADTGPIPHAVWCDAIDGDGLCFTLGGGTFQPPFARQAVQIANGAFHHCALYADGRARCWGDNTYSQVSKLPKEHTWAQVGAGWTFSCALTVEGDIHCWGYNGSGQTRAPEPGTGPWVQLTVGNDFACALDAEGRPVCWGGNGFGQLELPEDVRFLHLAAGGYHVCGITTEGETICWGADSVSFRSIGVLKIPPDLRFTNLAALRYQTCGRTTDEQIVCWGAGRFSVDHYPWVLNAPAERWLEYESERLLAEIGPPSTIALELELSLTDGAELDGGPYPGDQLQLTFIATVVDAEGRPVVDGTDVSWRIPTENRPEMIELALDGVTSGGRADARYVLLGPEPFEITVTAGGVSASMAFPPPYESDAVRWSDQD